MNRKLLFLCIFGGLLIPNLLSAQVLDSTVCDILANPQAFDGKIVRIRRRSLLDSMNLQLRATAVAGMSWILAGLSNRYERESWTSCTTEIH